MKFILLLALGGILTHSLSIEAVVKKEKSPLTKEEQESLNKRLPDSLQNLDVSLTRNLLEQGADINILQGGQTPLHIAVLINSPDLVQFLLAKGANPNSLNSLNFTPLYIALGGSSGEAKYSNIAMLLLQAGANPNLENGTEHKTSWEYMINVDSYSPDLFRALLLYGGQSNKEENKAPLIRRLTRLFPGESGTLFQAIAFGDQDGVKIFLANNKEIVRDKNGISALAYAAGQGNEIILSLLFKLHSYQQDTTGIEQAIEIVTNRLRGLKPESTEYTKYHHILQGLIRQLKIIHEEQLDLFLKSVKRQDPTLKDATQIAEIQEMLKQTLGTQDITQLLYGSLGKTT
jgi:hypothetical protein